MTDRELKRLLKNAYTVTASEKEEAFMKTYERRSRRFWNVLVLELKYMGSRNFLAGVFLCTLLFFLARQGDVRVKWTISSILPLFALVLSALVGRSERSGMEELEAASRFSLRFIRMTRMLILGTISFLLILVCTCILRKFLGISPMITVCFVGFPYLFNVWGSLLITRKWHAKENIYGCVGITFLSCLMPVIAEYIKLWSYTNSIIAFLAMLILLVGTVRESILYIKEGEDLSWNLC
ncbi:MAG: hypothetical protein ACI4FX_11060 [Agathobacter sp.]